MDQPPSRSKRLRGRVASRAIAQRSHAFRRAAERYNTWLSREDIASIIDAIRTNQARLVERQSNTRAIYAVEYEGTRYYVAYDKNTREISTFLTPEQGLTHELPSALAKADKLKKEK